MILVTMKYIFEMKTLHLGSINVFGGHEPVETLHLGH